MNFSNKNREQFKSILNTETFDVLVIGGGITGAGIALDAASRGMKIALVEMQDFAAGTSSRSTKLVHGGLRYLKQLHVKQVAEVGKERAIVYENGPHVTRPEWMLLPFYEGGTYGKLLTSIGLSMYDLLAGVKKSERKYMLTREQTLEKAPLIKKHGLKGGGVYVEYRTDDARLTIEVLKTAFEKGALALNYTKVIDFINENGKVIGVVARDEVTGDKYKIYARKIVNATGPWVDSIREKDRSKEGKVLKLTKGVHIVIDQSNLPLEQAVYFDNSDGRMIFAIPRDGKVYVGTTDSFYDNDPMYPRTTKEDVEYLLKAILYMFPDINLSMEHIESNWAGVRPLIWEEGKGPSEISRKDEIWESPSGLITIAGGKLTGYRKMAEKIVDLLSSKFKAEKYKIFSPCETKELKISGGDVGGSRYFKQYILEQVDIGEEIGLSGSETRHLANIYGSNVKKIFAIYQEGARVVEKYNLPTTLYAKLHYSLEHEMTVTPLDFFNRRTGAILFDITTVKKYKDVVITYMKDYFKWDDREVERYQQELELALEEASLNMN